MHRLALALLVAVAACSSTTPPPPPPEIPAPLPVVEPAPDDVAVCAHLGMLGCSDAWPNGSSCAEVFSQARTYHVPVPPDLLRCLLGAADLPAVRACGGSDTLTFACP